MQGRLSPIVDGRIQAFPESCWRDEFPIAEQLGFRLMEWTLDQASLYTNPLLTSDGQAEIRALSQRHGVAIQSLTGDCFMHAPFWKAPRVEQARLQRDFQAVAAACAAIGIAKIVVPLVDNGRLENDDQQKVLLTFLQGEAAFLAEHGLRLLFESDFGPQELASFIDPLDASLFGINYDTGNSASLGFRAVEEIDAYGHRIGNVHVKDRLLGGTTVPFGTGNADFEAAFASLARVKYAGNYILQPARVTDSDHAGALSRYRDMLSAWMTRHGA